MVPCVEGRQVYYPLSFDKLINYESAEYSRTKFLQEMFPEQNFTPFSSGTKLKSPGDILVNRFVREYFGII